MVTLSKADMAAFAEEKAKERQSLQAIADLIGPAASVQTFEYRDGMGEKTMLVVHGQRIGYDLQVAEDWARYESTRTVEMTTPGPRVLIRKRKKDGAIDLAPIAERIEADARKRAEEKQQGDAKLAKAAPIIEAVKAAVGRTGEVTYSARRHSVHISITLPVDEW